MAVVVSNTFTRLIPKDKELVLFSSWFGQKYLDSSRYVYEFCVENKLFKPYWYTRNKELYYSLRAKGMPVIYSKSIKNIIFQMRAIMRISSVQLSDFPHYFLANSIYLDLGHGFPIKQSGYEQPDVSKRLVEYELFVRRFIKYYMCCSSNWIKEIDIRVFKLLPEQVVLSNLPRTDVLFNPELRKGKNAIVDRIKGDKKAIVYMPTHRSSGRSKMCMDAILDLEGIQKLCEENNCVFFIKKHFYHRCEIENLEQYKNIFDITSEDIDPETLTYQADILISDYSAAYIEFLLLDRPVVFYAYDLEEYIKTERDMYLKFEDIHAGYKPRNKVELCSALNKLCLTWRDDEHMKGRHEIREKYFDKHIIIGKARYGITQIMGQLIDGTFKSNWEGDN